MEATISNYELAFRMQSEVPDLLDLKSETEATRKCTDSMILTRKSSDASACSLAAWWSAGYDSSNC